MKDLRRVMAYLATVESVPLEKVTWIEDGEPIPVTKEELAEWKFTGLNNRDFALILLEGRKAQNYDLDDAADAGGGVGRR
jgi:hypothetical protein